METAINIIKESFETWYNKNISKDSHASIVINYSDTQTLAIKAFHTITMEVKAIGIRNDLSYAVPIAFLKENYNHGTTTEQEAKDGLTKKLLVNLYGFKK